MRVRDNGHRHPRRGASPASSRCSRRWTGTWTSAGRAGHRPDAGATAGRDARRDGRGHERRVGKGQRVHRPHSGAEGSPTACECRSHGPGEVAGSKRRILVVDDNRDAAESLGMMLRLMGNEVRTAADGLAAVQAAEDFRPDMILLDIGLPKLNGYDACRRIREQALVQWHGHRRPDRLGSGRGPPPLAGGGIRSPLGQAGRDRRSANSAAGWLNAGDVRHLLSVS